VTCGTTSARPLARQEGVRESGMKAALPSVTAAHSRAMNGWRLDEEKLAQALAVRAPHVRIIRL